MATATDWKSERQAAEAAARQAGQILLDWVGRFSVRLKGKQDPVTEADLAAQEAVRGYLQRQFPTDQFLGEETDPSHNAALDPMKRTWIVDPLDGTVNFVHGVPFYCVSVALAVQGQPVVGVIYDPVRKECFAGAQGQGTTCNAVPVQVSPTADLGEGLFVAGLPADVAKNRSAIEVFSRMSLRSLSLRRMGSAALSLAYVATGRFDAFWAHHNYPWDVAAGIVLVREAGGKCSKLDQTSCTLDAPDLLASNGVIHSKVAAALAESTP